MFYYAEIDGEYLVINTYNLTESSANPNYVSITEEQYTSGDLVGKYYNSLRGRFESVNWDDWMGGSDIVGYNDTDMQLSTKIDNMQAEINSKVGADHTHEGYATADHTHSGYAASNHTHDGYATQVALDTLADEVDGKADANHSHTDYALTSHTHDGYAEVGHYHSNYAVTTHNHDEDYSPLSHSHNYNDLTNKPAIPSIDGLATEDYVDEKVATVTVESIGALPNTTVIPTVPTNVSAFANDAGYLTEHQSLDGLVTETYVNTQIDAIVIPDALSDLAADSTHRLVTDAEKAAWNAKSNFSGSYNDLTNKPTIPSISGLATEAYVDEAVSTKANSSHTHTVANVSGLQNALNGKSDSTHNHDTSYDAKGEANTALISANAYTDDAIEDEVANRDSAIATAKSSAISTAASDATTKANNALASAKTYADNAVAAAKNDLLNGAGAAYDTLKELGDLIDDNTDAINALETVASGKANSVHTHAISDITNLQTTLDGKAAASHGTHVSYSTTSPVMDGTASVGTATTVARSDHKHPTDTSRAAQTSLDSHTSNKSNPHGVTLAQLGITATATELNTLDGITATVTELNYVDGVTSNIQTQLNAKASSSHTHSYAGSSSVGGAATSANKLNTNAGDASTPVYFANGVPVACTSLDLNTTGNAATATNVAWSGVTSKPTYYDAKAIKSITRSGTTFTYTCMDGTTGTFTQQDNNTTYSAATTSANGLMSSSDKSKLDGMALATVSEVETYLAI